MPDGGVDIRARQPAAADASDRRALVDGAFPGCGVAIHYVSGDADPLFQTDKFAATQPTRRQLAAVKEKAGDPASVGRRWRRPSSY